MRNMIIRLMISVCDKKSDQKVLKNRSLFLELGFVGILLSGFCRLRRRGGLLSEVIGKRLRRVDVVLLLAGSASEMKA